MNNVRQPQNGKTVSGYTMGYLGLKKSSGNTNMIAMLTVTVCIKLQWAQQQAYPLWAAQHQPKISPRIAIRIARRLVRNVPFSFSAWWSLQLCRSSAAARQFSDQQCLDSRCCRASRSRSDLLVRVQWLCAHDQNDLREKLDQSRRLSVLHRKRTACSSDRDESSVRRRVRRGSVRHRWVHLLPRFPRAKFTFKHV